MATITITIPDAVVTRVTNALCEMYGYSLIDNPPTKTVFAKQQVMNFIKKTVKDYETNQASQTAVNTVVADVDSNVTLS